MKQKFHIFLYTFSNINPAASTELIPQLVPILHKINSLDLFNIHHVHLVNNKSLLHFFIGEDSFELLLTYHSFFIKYLFFFVFLNLIYIIFCHKLVQRPSNVILLIMLIFIVQKLNDFISKLLMQIIFSND